MRWFKQAQFKQPERASTRRTASVAATVDVFVVDVVVILVVVVVVIVIVVLLSSLLLLLLLIVVVVIVFVVDAAAAAGIIVRVSVQVSRRLSEQQFQFENIPRPTRVRVRREPYTCVSSSVLRADPTDVHTFLHSRRTKCTNRK